MLNRLEADGYTTVDRLRAVVGDAQAERESGESGIPLNELTSDMLACRR
jgi:hypothetical protein